MDEQNQEENPSSFKGRNEDEGENIDDVSSSSSSYSEGQYKFDEEDLNNREEQREIESVIDKALL